MITGQRQDGFIHHDDSQFSTFYRLAFRVGQLQIQAGFLARSQLLFLRGYAERQGAAERRNTERQAAAAKGRSAGGIFQRFTVIIQALRLPRQIHLNVQVGNMSIFNWDFQRGGAVHHLKPFGV